MAYMCYMTIKGSKQGRFRGGGLNNPWNIPILRFDESVNQAIVSPRDPASGMATGRRAHQGFSITREMDAASPSLQSALANNELLPAVDIEYMDSVSGMTHSIRLTNATIAGILPYLGPAIDAVTPHKLEEVSFACENIYVNGTPSASLIRLTAGPMFH